MVSFLGNSIGTINIAGNYTQNAGSFLDIKLDNSGNCNLLDVIGNTNINRGQIRIYSDAGSYTVGNLYTIIQTPGTVNSTLGFNPAILNQSGSINLKMNIIYTVNEV